MAANEASYTGRYLKAHLERSTTGPLPAEDLGLDDLGAAAEDANVEADADEDEEAGEEETDEDEKG